MPPDSAEEGMLLVTGGMNAPAGKSTDFADGALANAAQPQQGRAQCSRPLGQQGLSSGASRSDWFGCEAVSGLPERACRARGALGSHSWASQDSDVSQRSANTRGTTQKGTAIARTPRTSTSKRPIAQGPPHAESTRPPIMFPLPSLPLQPRVACLDSGRTPLVPGSKTRVFPLAVNGATPRT
jgi:hypothetical protein